MSTDFKLCSRVMRECTLTLKLKTRGIQYTDIMVRCSTEMIIAVRLYVFPPIVVLMTVVTAVSQVVALVQCQLEVVQASREYLLLTFTHCIY